MSGVLQRDPELVLDVLPAASALLTRRCPWGALAEEEIEQVVESAESELAVGFPRPPEIGVSEREPNVNPWSGPAWP